MFLSETVAGPNGTGAEGIGWCMEDNNQIEDASWGMCSRSCKFFSKEEGGYPIIAV